MLLQQPVHRLDENVGLALVVRRSARVDVVVANGRLERRRFPFVQRVRRLNVVMAIKQERRFPRSAQPLGVYQRIPLSFDELRLIEAGFRQLVADELGRLLNVRLVFGERTDARNAKERLESLQIFLMMLFDSSS